MIKACWFISQQAFCFCTIVDRSLLRRDDSIIEQILRYARDDSYFLKHFQLLYRWFGGSKFVAMKYLHHPKLLIRDTHNAYMPMLWQYFFHPLYMHFGIFPAGAMPHVNTELEHLKSIF